MYRDASQLYEIIYLNCYSDAPSRRYRGSNPLGDAKRPLRGYGRNAVNPLFLPNAIPTASMRLYRLSAGKALQGFTSGRHVRLCRFGMRPVNATRGPGTLVYLYTSPRNPALKMKSRSDSAVKSILTPPTRSRKAWGCGCNRLMSKSSKSPARSRVAASLIFLRCGQSYNEGIGFLDDEFAPHAGYQSAMARPRSNASPRASAS